MPSSGTTTYFIELFVDVIMDFSSLPGSRCRTPPNGGQVYGCYTSSSTPAYASTESLGSSIHIPPDDILAPCSSTRRVTLDKGLAAAGLSRHRWSAGHRTICGSTISQSRNNLFSRTPVAVRGRLLGELSSCRYAADHGHRGSAHQGGDRATREISSASASNIWMASKAPKVRKLLLTKRAEDGQAGTEF